MIWYILIGLFITLLLWILLFPVTIFVNSEHNQYHLSLPGVFKAVLAPNEVFFHIKGWIFFLPYRYDPFRRKKGKRKKENRKKRKGKKPQKLSWNIRMLNGVIRSFRIRKLHVDMDTDDVVLNAWLVPVFSLMNTENIQIRVNFEGATSLILNLRLTFGILIWNVVKNKYKSNY